MASLLSKGNFILSSILNRINYFPKNSRKLNPRRPKTSSLGQNSSVQTLYTICQKFSSEKFSLSVATVLNVKGFDKYLLSRVEAVVFAAAGFLFGREVNRARAEQAEERATTAQIQKSEAENQRTEAITKGKNLTAAINAKLHKAKTPSALSMGTLETTAAPAAPNVSQTDLEELQVLAQEMFP